MTQLNEYIMSSQEVDDWKETWDGKWESIPSAVHATMIGRMKENSNKLSLLADDVESYASDNK